LWEISIFHLVTRRAYDKLNVMHEAHPCLLPQASTGPRSVLLVGFADLD